MTSQSSKHREHQLPVPRTDANSARSSRIPLRGQASPQEQSQFDVAFFLSVFRQWWKIAVPAGLVLATIAAGLVIRFVVPEYKSSALILIESQVPYIAFKAVDGGRNANAGYIQTQLELLRSDIVLSPVISRPEIASLPELSEQAERTKHIKQHLTIKQVGQSELHEVVYVSHSPQAAADVANAVVAEYLKIQTDEDGLRAHRVIQILEEERRKRSSDVERMRLQVTKLAMQIVGGDPFGQNVLAETNPAANATTTLYQSMVNVDVEREMLKAEIQALRDTPGLVADHADDSGQLDLHVDSLPEVRERQTAINAIASQMEHIRVSGVRINWQSDPSYRQLEREFKLRQSELSELKATLRGALNKQGRETPSLENQNAIVQLERQLARLNVKWRLLDERHRQSRQDLRTDGGKTAELDFARAELAREESVFELIESRKLALQTELRAPTRVRLKQEAPVPSNPVEPVPYKLLLLACSAALALPFGLAIAHEVMVRRVSTVEQLLQHSNTRVLGEVARIPLRRVAATPGALPRRVRQEMTLFAESIDALRTNLVLSQSGEMTQVLAVSSAAAAEGKTTVATSLAASMAGATKKPTLIIDADLRSPDVANVLKIENHPGLGEVLAGECELSDAIHQLGNGDTYVIPAGTIKKNPHHLVQIQQVELLLDSLREQFANIVIDTAPVLGASESLVFAKAADAVLYCSLSGSSRARQVSTAVDRLRHAGCNIVGSVISGTPASRYAYVYGYYPNQSISDANNT